MSFVFYLTARLEPAVEIGDLLSSSDTRASMSLTLTIFAHYEWPVLATGPVKSVQLALSIWDTTCWLSETRTFGKKAGSFEAVVG